MSTSSFEEMRKEFVEGIKGAFDKTENELLLAAFGYRTLLGEIEKANGLNEVQMHLNLIELELNTVLKVIKDVKKKRQSS